MFRLPFSTPHGLVEVYRQSADFLLFKFSPGASTRVYSNSSSECIVRCIVRVRRDTTLTVWQCVVVVKKEK